MRTRRAVAVGIAATVVAVGLSVPGAGAADDPVVTATPATDLVDGDSIRVSISGTLPQSEVFTALCPADTTDIGRCDPALRHAATTSAAGATEFDFGIEAVFGILTGTGIVPVDCRVAPGCGLLTFAMRADGSVAQVATPLGFRPDGPLLPAPTLTATPSEDLVDAQAVQLAGAGFVPFTGVEIAQCRAPYSDGFDCDGHREFAGMAADGSFGVEVEASTILVLPVGDEVDCRIVACEFVVTRGLHDPEARQTATVPVAFRPDGPLRPPPTLTVTPSSGLTDQQVVQVDGARFRDNVAISQCVPGDGPAFERCTNPVFVNVGADGLVTTAFTVDARLTTDAGPADCRIAPGCTVAALDAFRDKVHAEVPVDFAGDDPPPPGHPDRHRRHDHDRHDHSHDRHAQGRHRRHHDHDRNQGRHDYQWRSGGARWRR